MPIDDDDRDSGMSIDLTISIGYKRRRPEVHGDRLEARMDSIGLLVVGAIIVLVTLVWLVPKILALIP